MSTGLGAARIKFSPPGAGKQAKSIWGNTNRSADGGFWGRELKQGEGMEDRLHNLAVAFDGLREYYSYIGIDRNQTIRSGTGGGGNIFNENAWMRLVRGLDQPGLGECAAALADVKEMLGAYLATAGAAGGISGMKTRYAGFPVQGGGGR
jgi:hypothetical protein